MTQDQRWKLLSRWNVTVPAAITLGVVVVSLASQGCAEETCAECMQEKCSDLIALCEVDAGCACMSDCTGQSGVPGVEGCLATCGLGERPVGFAQLEECTAVACPDTGDECSTPSGWTPPGDAVTCDGMGTGGLGGGGLPDCSFDPGLVFDSEGAVLQLQSADQSLCARVERRNDGAGSLANTEWTLLELRAGPLGEVALVEGEADLCWYSSHHNFRDWAHAWTGTRRYDLVLKEDGHGGARTYWLYVFEQGPLDGVCSPTTDGQRCIDGPIELFPVSP